MALQDQASPAGKEKEGSVSYWIPLVGTTLQVKHPHTLSNTFTAGNLIRHSVNKAAVIISIHGKQTGSLHFGVDRAATDHRNVSIFQALSLFECKTLPFPPRDVDFYVNLLRDCVSARAQS